jgi:hypothetical protein
MTMVGLLQRLFQALYLVLVALDNIPQLAIEERVA